MHSVATMPAQMNGHVFLARVTSVKDPKGIGQVEVELLSYRSASNQQSKIWARVAVPFAGAGKSGKGKGAFMLPDVDDEVLVTFVNGDPRYPIIIGALWNGGAKAPETLGGDKSHVDRWSITGREGTRIAIEEEQAGHPTIKLTTPGKVSAELSDLGGGTIQCRANNHVITVDADGVTIDSGARVTVVAAAQVEVTAATVNVNAPMTNFSGVVKCDTLLASTVVSATYTPGAGNIW